MTTRKHNIYTKEFKLEAIKLVIEQGYKQSEASRSLGIEPSLLGKWVRSYKLENNTSLSFPGKGNLNTRDAELSELRKQLNKVTRERDILKKAIGYFTAQPE